jgi:hypothetical protein
MPKNLFLDFIMIISPDKAILSPSLTPKPSKTKRHNKLFSFEMSSKKSVLSLFAAKKEVIRLINNSYSIINLSRISTNLL